MVARWLRTNSTHVMTLRPTGAPHRPAVALFDQSSQARQALQALRGLGLAEQQVGFLAPRVDANQPGSPDADVSGLLAVAAGAGDLTSVLTSLGLPEGEARYYADAVAEGRALVIADAGDRGDDTRTALLGHGGYDVEARGADLARPTGAGISGGTGARPSDLTGDWDDVASRYEMLWQQHYGTSDQTWAGAQPVYRWAWSMANDPDLRGRPWSEVAALLERRWADRADSAVAWSAVQGPVRDVWEDVAAEAAQGFEGGQDRRIPRQGTDQEVSTRDLLPPPPPRG